MTWYLKDNICSNQQPAKEFKGWFTIYMAFFNNETLLQLESVRSSDRDKL